MKSKPNTIALMTAYALTVIWLFASQGVQAETIPNGRIVYADSTGAFHVLDLSTGNITPVPVPEANPPWDFQATPSWSRDGNYIAFRGGYNFHSQLYVMRPDGSAFSDGAIIHRITDGSGDWGDQSLSPDGRQLAFHNGLSLQLATLDCGLDLETCMNRTPVTHGSGVHAA